MACLDKIASSEMPTPLVSGNDLTRPYTFYSAYSTPRNLSRTNDCNSLGHTSNSQLESAQLDSFAMPLSHFLRLTESPTMIPMEQSPQYPNVASFPGSKSLYDQGLQERTLFYNLRQNHTTQRIHFRNALSKLDSITEKLEILPISRAEHHDSIRQLQDVIREVHQLDQVLVNYETDMNASEARLEALESRLRRKDHDIAFRSPHAFSNNGEDSYDQAELESFLSSSQSWDMPPLVREYYQHVAAIRYLSDELYSLGQQPIKDSGTDFTKQSNVYSASMSEAEYIRLHLQLVRDVRLARREKARLKKLCIDQGYTLEESVQDDEGEDYHHVVDMMQTGPPRIDSLLADRNENSQSPFQWHLYSAAEKNDDSITRWAATVPTSSNVPLESSAEMVPDLQIESNELCLQLPEDARPFITDVRTSPQFYGERPARRYSMPYIDVDFDALVVDYRITESDPGSR